MDEIVGQLSESQYYKWRFLMEEMLHWEFKIKYSRLYYSHMEKDIEIQRLKTAIHKNVIKDHEGMSDEKKKHYEDYRQELEKQLNLSLEECTIDDMTFEVRKIPKD